MTRIVGLTGGIGTGKSTVARLFEELGAVVIDADAIVHELQAAGSESLDAIAAAFGHEMIRGDGTLDRERLGSLVFSDAEARRSLNAIMHPRVGAEMGRRLAAARDAGVPVVLLDIPLLFEGRSGSTQGGASNDRHPASQGMEAVIVVYAPESLQLQRLMARDGTDRDEALRRIRSQLPIEQKRRLADHVIDNSGSLDATRRQVTALFERLRGEPAPSAEAPGR